MYYQTHFFDGAYPEPDTGKRNSLYPWAFVDYMVELYFSSPEHMWTVFTSDHVRTVVGPDDEAFNDFGAANAMLSSGDRVILGGDVTEEIDPALIANCFVEANDSPAAGTEFVAYVQPILLDCIKKLGFDQISKVVVTTRIPDSANMLKYFGGDAPSLNYSAVFTMYIRSLHSVPAVRNIQEYLRRLQVCN